MMMDFYEEVTESQKDFIEKLIKAIKAEVTEDYKFSQVKLFRVIDIVPDEECRHILHGLCDLWGNWKCFTIQVMLHINDDELKDFGEEAARYLKEAYGET